MEDERRSDAAHEPVHRETVLPCALVPPFINNAFDRTPANFGIPLLLGILPEQYPVREQFRSVQSLYLVETDSELINVIPVGIGHFSLPLESSETHAPDSRLCSRNRCITFSQVFP